MAASSRELRVFLCHSSGDQHIAHDLYCRLSADGIDPWLDVENLLPGQDWELEISRSVKKSDVIIVCLSDGSINKRGFVQKEIRYALDVADEQPEGTIFLIPLKLEECEVPDRLRGKQWVDYFQPDGYARLLKALAARARELGAEVPRVPVSDKTESPVSASGRAPRNLSAAGAGLRPNAREHSASADMARAGRGRLRSRPAAVMALLVSGLLLILGISFARQWMRREQRPQRAAYEQELARLNQPSASPLSNGPSEIDFTLYPNSVRGDGVMSTIRSSPSMKTIRLHLSLLEDKYQSYRGELLAEDGQEMAAFTDLRASMRDDREVVILKLPAQGLAAGDYRIRLYGRTFADDMTQDIASYYFRVVHH